MYLFNYNFGKKIYKKYIEHRTHTVQIEKHKHFTHRYWGNKGP